MLAGNGVLDVWACARAIVEKHSAAGWALSSCLLPAAGVFIWSFFLGTFTHPDIWDDPDSFKPVSFHTSIS
jgi:hypothetical protein